MSDDRSPVDAGAIRSLDERTIERIAAGEVVERPASAVKELVENSLDAGARRIEVAVEAAGAGSIRVSDDGLGMTESAVRKAIRPHTTSKLRDIDDLSTGPDTLGFRGEALYTIAAVSRLTISTRPHDANEPGTELRVEGGQVESVRPAGCPPGTTVEVRELFYNTPARRAFLRSEGTEFDHVNRVVANYALANPHVAISLRHDGTELFATPGQGDLRGAVLAVYGRDVATTMIDVESVFGEPPIERVRGLVSDPETVRSRPRYVSTFVNSRYVESKRLRAGVIEAYGGQLAPDRYPFAVLFCEVPPGSVDVNVHPRKMQVRFEQAEAVATRIAEAVSSALIEEGMIRSTSPRGSAAPEATKIVPSAQLETDRSETEHTGDVASTDSGHHRGSSRGLAANAKPPNGGSARSGSEDDTVHVDVEADRKFRGATRQRTVDDDEPRLSLSSLPRLRLLGQLGGTYIVAEAADGLVLIDQHAADERINFERLRTLFREAPDSQQLVTPVDISLTADEAGAFPLVEDGLSQLGFEATLAESRTLRVSAVPAVLDSAVPTELVRDVVGSAIETGNAGRPVDDLADAVLGDMACYPAVTGHTRLSEGSMVELLRSLDACDNPYACPHGRPILIRIDNEELEKRFERDYPGHATRRPE